MARRWLRWSALGAVGLVFAFGACIGGPAAPSLVSSPSGSLTPGPVSMVDPATCQSPDRRGLIGCEEAVQLAVKHGSPSPPFLVTARLARSRWWKSRPALLWMVTFHGVEIDLDGPRGGCVVGDWNVVIRASDGTVLGGGTWNGPRSACPRIPVWATPAPS